MCVFADRNIPGREKFTSNLLAILLLEIVWVWGNDSSSVFELPSSNGIVKMDHIYENELL